MELNKNVPAIRFNGFEEEWNKNVLGDIGKTFTGLSGKTKEDFGFGEGRFVTYMNVFSNIISDLKRIDKVQVDKIQNSVQFGDVFFTTSSETPEEVGMSSIWLFNENNVYLNSFCFGYRLNIVLNHYYLAYYLRSSSFRKKIIPLAQGISRYNISKGKVMELDISLPFSTEQTQIGNFFKTIDEQINLQEQKHQKLVNLKKAMLEKMFPKEGTAIPEIRFKGFTENWETVQIKEICSISTGKSNTQDKIENGIYPFYVRSATIERSNRFLYDEEAVLTVGDGVGTGKVFHYVKGKYDLHQRVYRMYNFNNVKGKFFYHVFSKEFYKRVMSMTAKTSVDSVRLDMIANMFILVPKVEEQTKIINILENIDNLINQSQVQIQKHKNIKQALLQKMFV